MDQEHAKFVLATGFHKFWRGALQKERMSVPYFKFEEGVQFSHHTEQGNIFRWWNIQQGRRGIPQDYFDSSTL